MIHDLQHGQIPAVAALHVRVARHGKLLERPDIFVELLQRHAREGRGYGPAVVDLQPGEGLARFVLFLYPVCRLALEIRRLVPVFRVLQHAVFEQRIVKVIRVGLAEKRPVQIEYGDAVPLGDIVRAVFVRHGLDVRRQSFRGGGAVRPQ